MSTVMICIRAIGNPDAPSEKRKCEKCGHDIWISEESIKVKDKRNATLRCLECVSENITPDTTLDLSMSAGQKKEFLEAIGENDASKPTQSS